MIDSGFHQGHQDDFDHYTRVQFVYNRDTGAHVKHALMPKGPVLERQLAITAGDTVSRELALVNHDDDL